MTDALRVAYDCTPLLGTRTGIGTMTARLLDELAADPALGLDLRAFAVTWRGRDGLAAVVPAGVRVASRPVPARLVHELWRRVEVPPVEWLTGRVDVVHGPNFVVPPARRAARVVTVHDLTCLHHPELVTAHARRFPALVARAVARGAFVHTVSDAVRAQVLDAFAVEPERVVTIPNGVDALPAADPAEGCRLAGGDRYVLALGTVEPRKRLPALVAAFDRVAGADPTLRLVLAGPDGWGTDELAAAVAAARHRDRVVRVGWVDEAARAALVRGALALALVSHDEGFGLPPLEAMSAGVPVLVSDAPALVEVAGGAALVVPVDDPGLDALAAGLAAIVHDDGCRARLAAAGPPRAAGFTWRAAARAMARLYRGAALP